MMLHYYLWRRSLLPIACFEKLYFYLLFYFTLLYFLLLWITIRDIVTFHFHLNHQCEEWYCFLSQSRLELAVPVDSQILMLVATCSLWRCYAFMAASLENSTSHGHAVGMGRSLSSVDSVGSDHFWRLHQNSVNGTLSNGCLSVNAQVPFSRSWTDVSSDFTEIRNGFLAHDT